MALSQSLGVRGPALKAGPEWKYNKWLGRWRMVDAEERPGEAVRPNLEDVPEAAMPFDDSDKVLVERVKVGDVRAFEMLHRRYYGRIYRLGYLRLGNAEDAADVASTCFCKALRSIGGYQFRRSSSIYPWLHQIASNLIVDVIRDQPPGGMLSLDAQAAEDVDSFLEYLPADGPSAQELVERGEVQEVVREAINRLPADQARAVALRFLGDLSIRDIAQALDRSEGAVKSLLHRALQGMRQHLKAAAGAALAGSTPVQHTRSERGESHVAEVINVRSSDS